MSVPKTYRNPLATLRAAKVPDSVGVSFERARCALHENLGDAAASSLAEALVALRVHGADAALLDAIVQRAALLALRLGGPGGLGAWLSAVTEVAQQARHCTLALLESSEEVLRHGSPAELLMWARLGLRGAHSRLGNAADGSDARLAHFRLQSRESAAIAAPHGGHVDLASCKPRLVHYLRALFDLAPAILPIEQALATTRPFISNLGLHVPEASRALRGEPARRWYDAAAAHAAVHLRHSTHRFERGSLKPIQIALAGLLEDARVEWLACPELPGLRRLWLGFHCAEPSQGASFVVLMLRLARCLLDPAHEDPHPWVAKARRLFFEATFGGAGPERLTPTLLRDIASRLGNDIGQMRLQFNARTYVVEPSYRDDNANLWLPTDDPQPQLQRMADELPLPPDEDSAAADPIEDDRDDGEPEVRARPVPAGAPLPDTPMLSRFQYPEWDRLAGAYRADWCSLIEIRPARADPSGLARTAATHAGLIERLDRVLRANRVRQRVKLRAQPRGDELDIDAVVRSTTERRSGHPPGQKVYQRNRPSRARRGVAAAARHLGVDRADGGGRTVLDLARDAALLTALTMDRAGDRCAIHGFCSNGRHEVRYECFKGFDEPIGPRSLARLAGMRSRLSTRMGAALRHATRALAAERHERRVLLLITDGEPHDIDVHDPRYLIEDARHTVREAARLGVALFCVTLDPAADRYLREIFGHGNFRVLDRVEALPEVLPAMYLRLTR